MEADKENLKRLLSTKIPLPLQPFPPLPTHLLKIKGLQTENKQKRSPLKTLNSQAVNFCLPSTSKNVLKPVKRLSLDTRHVTLRQRSEDLDWNYKVFKEDDDSIITISDDESYLSEGNDVRHSSHFMKNVDKTRCEKVLTPIPKSPLESNRVRNIKKSLKRPSSRELQGVSPSKKSKIEEKSFNRRIWTIHDGLKDRLSSPDFLKRIYMSCVTKDYCTDIFTNLLASECPPLAVPRLPSITRACVINWLMKVNGPDGNPAVLHTAIWYLDSILGLMKFDLDKLQLIAASCYWIAQKLNGPYLTAARLVAYSRNAFTVAALLEAEKLILCSLKFPPQPVVPQEFITYLSWWCDSSRPGEIEVAATFICMSGLMVDKSLCKELPSAISAASVYNAVMLLKKRNLVQHLQKNAVYMEIEKKTADLGKIRSILRKAVRTIASPVYKYKVPFEHFEVPPLNIAQRVADGARELAIIDAKWNKHHEVLKK